MRMQTMSLWAYATLEARVGTVCLAALAAEGRKQLPRMDAQHVLNMLWAFAKLGYNPGAALMRACDAHATRAPSSFSGHGLVCCCFCAAAPRVSELVKGPKLKVEPRVNGSSCESQTYIDVSIVWCAA